MTRWNTELEQEILTVSGTCVGNEEKVKHLTELPKADTNLTVWKAEMKVEGSYDEAVQGCEGVFHLGTPMDFESNDPQVNFSNQ